MVSFKKVKTDNMVAQLLKEFFDPYIKLELQVWRNFEQLGEVIQYPKETILKPAGTVEKYMNFIMEGSGGNLIWKKNNFVCIDISFDRDFLNDYMSFTTRQPTPIEVRLFEDATIFRISHQEFQKTFASGAKGEKVSRIAAEASYIHKQNQQIDLLTKTAKERYLEMLKTNPQITRTPLKYLASYLGITPQSLSRIRSGKLS
jgi:hypothetical protein